MANSFSPLELVSDRLNTIHTAIDALFKHTTKHLDELMSKNRHVYQNFCESSSS